MCRIATNAILTVANAESSIHSADSEHNKADAKRSVPNKHSVYKTQFTRPNLILIRLHRAFIIKIKFQLSLFRRLSLFAFSTDHNALLFYYSLSFLYLFSSLNLKVFRLEQCPVDTLLGSRAYF